MTALWVTVFLIGYLFGWVISYRYFYREWEKEGWSWDKEERYEFAFLSSMTALAWPIFVSIFLVSKLLGKPIQLGLKALERRF